MTQRIYRLVVASMAVIAILAVVRSFAGGNEVAGQRLGWGALAFTYPGMWDLLGITGSVLWVSTRPGLSPRRWGIGITLVAVAVVAVSVGSEAYVLARDVLPAGWPEAAFVASAAVPVIYAVLTHVAAQCRAALELEEEPSLPTTLTTRATASRGPRHTTESSPAAAPSSTPDPPRPTALTTPATTTPPGPALDPTPPLTSTATGSSTDASSPSTLPPAPAAYGSRPPTGPPESTSRTPLPDSSGSSTATSSASPTPDGDRTPPASELTPTSPSAYGTEPATELELESTSPNPPASDATTDELEALYSEPSAPAHASPSSTPPAPPTGPPPSPTVEELERDDPNRYPAPDGQATREARRRWALEQMRNGVDVSGADVETRFGLPRSGAAIVREARQRLDDERARSAGAAR